MKYTVFSNFKRMVKRVYEKDRILFLYFFIYTITASIYPFIGIFLPKVIIGEIIKVSPNFINIVYYI